MPHTSTILPQNILIIKHGAFGDIIKTLKSFEVIRNHFRHATITLLTTPPFKNFCQKMPYFDAIMIDPRDRNPFRVLKILEEIVDKNFDLCIDLQGSNRTNRYFKYLNFRRLLPWVGHERCQIFHPMAIKKGQHPYAKQQTLLAKLNIILEPHVFGMPTLDWIKSSADAFNLPKKYAVLIPGSSSRHPSKRWPAKFYGQIAWHLHSLGIKAVIVGHHTEHSLAQQILSVCPAAVDLTGQTQIEDIYPIAKKAQLILGNDTGPLYLAATALRPTVIFWSDYVKPEQHAPLGTHIHLIEKNDLSHLSSDYVWHKILPIIEKIDDPRLKSAYNRVE